MELQMEKEADRLISGTDVDKMFGIEKTTRYRHIQRGLIPRPIKLAATSARWSYQECVAALEDLKAKARAVTTQ
jgi:predicted DNA-binding transcriptional regulator AlpA